MSRRNIPGEIAAWGCMAVCVGALIAVIAWAALNPAEAREAFAATAPTKTYTVTIDLPFGSKGPARR